MIHNHTMVCIKSAVTLFVLFFTVASQNVITDIASPAVLFETLVLNHDIPTKKKPKYRSPTALVPSPDGTKMFIAEQTAKKITEYDVVNKKVLRRIDLPNEVTGIALNPDGTILYATCASDWWPAGMVCVIDIVSGKVLQRISDGVGHFPRSPVLSPDGEKLYTCNQFSDDISVISTVSNTVINVIECMRQPYTAAIAPDGKRLLVGNVVPDYLSTDTSNVSCELTIFSTESDDSVKNIHLPRISTMISDVAVSPDGKYACASHLSSGPYSQVTTVASGWTHTNTIAVIDMEAMTFVNDIALDFQLQGMADPWEIAFAGNKSEPDSVFMCVAHAGVNSISIIQFTPFINTVLEFAALDSSLRKTYDVLTDDMRTVADVESKGCRTLAVIEHSVFTTGYFDDENAIMEEYAISLSDSVLKPIKHSIGEPVTKTDERLGEQYFYDADLCMQEWQSCHSCHLFSRIDGLNWQLNAGCACRPKTSSSILYSWWTPPTDWTGKRESTQASIRAGIQLELFHQPDEEITTSMDTFSMYLKPVSSPYLVKGRLSESAQRGRELFYNSDKVNCMMCHKAPLFCDSSKHAILNDPFDANPINVPCIKECWRTAPYGHLGSIATVRDMLDVPTHSNVREQAAAGILTEKDIDDIVSYVLSL